MKKCPVCGKEYKNISSHFSKIKCQKHKEYKLLQFGIILERFKSGVDVKDLQTTIFSHKELVSLLKSHCNYREIINKNNSLRKRLHGNIRSKTKNVERKAVIFFNTTLSISKISKKLNIHEVTLKKIWIKHFGENAVRKRIERTRYLHLRNDKNYCSVFYKNKKSYDLTVSLFYSDKSGKDVSILANISQATVINIWKKTFGINSYNKRKKRMKKEQQRKSLKCCKTGSKNEILCYKMLKDKYPYTIHHDYSLVKNLEIDISIPNKKIAINWDGKVHREPIYGEKSFQRIQLNNKIRIETLNKKGWTNIIVTDNGSYNPRFVSNKVTQILTIIESNKTGKIII